MPDDEKAEPQHLLRAWRGRAAAAPSLDDTALSKPVESSRGGAMTDGPTGPPALLRRGRSRQRSSGTARNDVARNAGNGGGRRVRTSD